MIVSDNRDRVGARHAVPLLAPSEVVPEYQGPDFDAYTLALFYRTDLTPYEYFARLRAPADDDPERGLLLAVLADAVDIVSGHGKRTENSERQEYLVADTVRWFFDATPDRWPFTFRNICEQFDFNAAKIIAALGIADKNVRAPRPRPRGRWQIFGERKGRAAYDEGSKRSSRSTARRSVQAVFGGPKSGDGLNDLNGARFARLNGGAQRPG